MQGKEEAKDTEEQDQVKYQRSLFEDSLKYAAANLSNKTSPSSLVSLLRQTAFLDNQELADKLLGYLKHKLSQLSNEEISQVYSSLVLLKPAAVDPKTLKVLEYLTLRRVHSLDLKELALIGKASL